MMLCYVLHTLAFPVSASDMIPFESIVPDPYNQVYSRDVLSIQSLSHDAANWATLCPELIYEILTYCLSGVTLSAVAPGFFPWYLGHICQSWRSVFTSSPPFWDRFTFEASGRIEMATISRLERALALIDLCIERTKDHPFSFKFSGVTDTNTAQSLYSFQILENLVAHADRWHAVCLIADADGLRKSLAKAKRRFGQLHSIQISTDGGTSSNIFQDAPNLTRAYVTNYYQLLWSNITVLHIQLEPHNAHRFFANLDKMTYLEELVIRGSGFHDVGNTRPIELPRLKILSADHFFPLSLITTPVLERLYLAGPLIRGIPAAETLLRGVTHLKTLSLDVHNFEVTRIIDCTPKLDDLILSCNFITLFDALQSLLQSLASHSTARSLRRIKVGAHNSQPGVLVMVVLLIAIKSWEKRQFPKLRFVSVHVNGNGSEEGITSAVADLMRVGAGKGFEIDVNFTPFPMIPLPFEIW